MNRREKLNYIAENYMKLMWQKAYSVISDAHEAEDACQEAFIKIIRMIDEIEDVTELKARALCCIIAKNTAIDMVRKHSRVAPTEDVFIELEARQKPADSPDAVVESKAETERIRLALNRLPEAYREIIELRCLHELSAQRTGEILGISANSVNIKLSRARKALKDILDRENIEERTEAAQDDR